MSDEGFHEIQLNGKQLVFLFMAATVVAVVIFLCGVMVGRGVPTRAASASDAPERAGLDPTAVLQEFPAAQTMASTSNAPVAAQETLTYPSLLEDTHPPAETLKPAIEPSREASPAPRAQASGQGRANASAAVATPPAAVTPVVIPATPAAAAPKPVAEPPVARGLPPSREASAGRGQVSGQIVDAALAEPPGTGFAVQVAAVRQRAEANTIARRLSTKGYPAFVTAAGANFRVRVGKYTDRREAESIAGRLEKEEQFKPWITR